MSTENTVLMSQAKDALKGKWGLAIGSFVIYILIVGSIGAFPKIGSLASLIVSGPFMLGISFFSLSLSRNKNAKLPQIFYGFNFFVTACSTYLLMLLFIVLWSLLLIIPGIIAGLSYAMTFYIVADDTSIGAMDALRKSKAMMNGFKLKLFYMGLRFLVLSLLCLLTLGIGFLWLIPYIQITVAKFYDDVRGSAPDSHGVALQP